MPGRRFFLAKASLVFAAGWGAAVGCLAASDAALPSPPLQRLEVRDVGGGGFDPATLRGQPAVIYVWGHWCRACSRSTPEVLALAARQPGARFVFVNTDQPPASLSEVVTANVLDLRVDSAFFGADTMRRKGFRFSELGLVFGVPAYYLLDAEGRIRARGNGSRYVPTLEDALRPLLAP